MKRILSLLVTVLFVIILSACARTSGIPVEPYNENTIINVKNNANFDIYGVEVKILGHSPTAVNADGSKIKKGESLVFEFLNEDSKLDGEATMEVSILNDKNDVISIDKNNKIEMDNNIELFFEIIGDSIKEASLKRVN